MEFIFQDRGTFTGCVLYKKNLARVPFQSHDSEMRNQNKEYVIDPFVVFKNVIT